MECKLTKNLETCNCTYQSCSRKGTCCDCLAYHRRYNELPACFFPPEAERTFNRSFEYFASLVTKGKI